MKIVCTSDTHFKFEVDEVPDGDVLIHAGDLMYEGTPDEWGSRLECLSKLPHKQKFYTPGNHDYFPYHYWGVARAQLRKAGVIMLEPWEKRVLRDDLGNGYTIVSHPGVTNLPGWAFPVSEEYMKQGLMEHGAFDDADIIVTHAPPYRILDEVKPDLSVGCMAYNYWFYNGKCTAKLWVCGHIHESYGHKKIAGTTIVNASMCDREYKRVNKPIIFDMNLEEVL